MSQLVTACLWLLLNPFLNALSPVESPLGTTVISMSCLAQRCCWHSCAEWWAGKGKEEARACGAPMVCGRRLVVLGGGLGGIFISLLLAMALYSCDTKSMVLHLCVSVLKPLIPWALSLNPSQWDIWRRGKGNPHSLYSGVSVVFCTGGRTIYYKQEYGNSCSGPVHLVSGQ